MTRMVSFEDLILQKIDNRGKTPPIVSDGHPLLEVNSISKASINPNVSKASKFVDQSTWDNWFRQHLEEHDILFTTVGTIAESAIVPINPNFAIAQNILGFRFDKNKIDPFYALYLMRGPWFLHQISGRTIETVQKSIKWADMRGIKINLPDLSEQKRIAEILRSLDEKIELNRRMNETLEQIGQTLFKYYFITNQADKDQTKVTIGDVADIIDCLHSKKPEQVIENTGYIFLQLNNITNSGILDLTNKFYISDDDYNKWTSRIEASENDFVITNVGRSGAVAKIPRGVKAALGRNMTAIRLKDDFMYPGYFSFYLNSDYLKRQVESNLDQGTILSALNVKTIPKLKLPDASHVIAGNIEKQLYALRTKIEDNYKDIQTITTLRDTLLPRLISGKIKT
jgi:type I restriction enzyme S subunit